MKKLTFSLIVILLMSVTSAFINKGQAQGKPPYPILFVHGWYGNEETFEDWTSYLQDFGWINGQKIDVCLDSKHESLMDPVSDEEVKLMTGSINPADFYFINFDINKNGDGHPDNDIITGDIFNTSEYTSIINWDNNDDIHPGDLLAIRDEFAKIISIDGNIISIQRGLFNTTPVIHLGDPYVRVRILSNNSNQNSIVKSGYGLKKAIDLIKVTNSCEKVILVCHSMGGLTAREYVQGSLFDENNPDVALIVTYSTPHMGSNKSDDGGWFANYLGFNYDLRSDAVRDLRYCVDKCPHGPPGPEDSAPYLFGGWEDNPYWDPDFAWYSRDINADGDINDNLVGLNEKEWPTSVLMHCVIGERDGTGSDDIVRSDRQYPAPGIVPGELIEVSTIILNGLYIAHLHTHKRFPEVFNALDEPDLYPQAYEVKPSGNYINGFINYQNDGSQIDYDWYKFKVTASGQASVTIYNMPGTNPWYVKIYDQDLYVLDEINENSNRNVLSCNVTQNHNYYLQFAGVATSETWNNPYKFKVSIASLPQITISSAQFNKAVYSPSENVTLSVALANMITGANVTYTLDNNAPNPCTDIGIGVYQQTFSAPSSPGTHNVIVYASKAGYSDATPYNLSLVVQNAGGSPYPPSIEITYPNNDICHDAGYIIWNDSDPDNNAVIYLYYDNNNSGLDGTCINPNNPIYEDGGDSYVWNTLNMPEGIYWIYATINDGTTTTSDYSPGYLEIDHPDENTDFEYQSKSAEEHDGDGDLIIESGESFKLDVWIRNSSSSITYKYVNGTLLTSNGNVTITDNESYYGEFAPGVYKKGDNRFEIQVASGFTGTVSFQLSLEFKDAAGHMFYQVVDVPGVRIYGNVSPSFQVVDVQIIDDGSHCNNDGILQSGENSIDYKLKIKNTGNGPANNIECIAQAFPPEFETGEDNASYPNISAGNSSWPETDDHFILHNIPSTFTGTINNEVLVTWGDNGAFSAMIPYSLQVFPAPRLGYFPESFDFGIVRPGETAIIPSFIRNYGSADLIISQIENLSNNPDNSLTGITFPLTIAPGDTARFNINITRSSQENISETFRIHSNNHTLKTHDIIITGTFYQPAPQGYVEAWNSDPSTLDGDGWIEPANLDNDNLIDLVTYNNNEIYFWEQSAVNSLEFVHKYTITVPGTEVYIMSLRIGNCDGDNKTDIVIREQDEGVNPMTARLRVYETSGNDQYAQVWSKTISTSTSECLEVGNCDADANDEILIYASGTVYVYNSSGDNNYSTTWNSGTTVSDNGASPYNMGFMTTGDTDNDGKKEIIFPGDDQYMFIWEKNSSGSGYTLAHTPPLVTFTPNPEGAEVYPKVFDIDNDNVKEIVISGDGEGFQFSVFNPTTWTYEFHNSPGLYDEFSSPAIADLNGNGIPEVFLGEDGGGVKRMVVYEYSNGSYFETFVSPDFNGDDIYNIRSYDFNNDGVQELVLGMADNFRIWKYEEPVLLPDLQVASGNISFSNTEPFDNDSVNISALVRNLGTADAQNVPVEFYLSEPSAGIRLDSLSVPSLPIGGSSQVSIPWLPDQSGNLNVYVVINRKNTVNESDFSNNIAFKAIHVRDNDTIPPQFINHSHSEYLGDGDGLIEDNEYIRVVWRVNDESGIKNTIVTFNGQTINGIPWGNNYYAIISNQPKGLFLYQINATDNDNSSLQSSENDTILIIQHAPLVTGNHPLASAVDVSQTDSVYVDFDMDMNSGSINSNTFLLFKNSTQPVAPLSVKYYPANHRAVMKPSCLEPNAGYEVRLISGPGGIRDINGNSLESNYTWTFAVETNLLPASSITATTVSSSQINISWDEVTGAAGYTLWSPHVGLPQVLWNVTLGPGVTSYSHKGLPINTEVCYYVRAFNSYGESPDTGPSCATTFNQPPAITLSVSSLPYFGEIQVESSSAPQNYMVTGEHLTGNLFVTAPDGFNISLNSETGFTDSLTLIPNNGTVIPTTIYVCFNPTCVLVYQDNIAHSSSGADTKIISVTGTGTPFTTPCPGTPSITYGGQTYNTIQIGSQCWLRENLNVGTLVNSAINMSDNGVTEKYCYGNDPANCDIYGGLYQWDEMMQYTTVGGTQGICPSGWHIPTDNEWCQLETFVDPTVNCSSTGYLGTDAGGILKESGLAHWLIPNTGATNAYGFTILPGGNKDTNGDFTNLTKLAGFQTSTQVSSSTNYRLRFDYDNAKFNRIANLKTDARSVRCLKTQCSSITPSNAGPDQLDLYPLTTTLSANTPSINETGQWVVVDGIGGIFTDVTNPVTEFSGTRGVIYSLSWIITNSCGEQSTDNVLISFAQTVPVVNVSVSILSSFGSVPVGTYSVPQSFVVSGNYLEADIVLTCPEGFEISEYANSGYSSDKILSPVAGNVNPTELYVRFTPENSIDYSGNIIISSTGVVDKLIAVSGTGIPPTLDLINGMASYYKFDGDLTDCVGPINGTNNNTSDVLTGKINHARSFTGNNNCYVETGSYSGFEYLHNGSDFTISVWVKHNSNLPTNNSYHILGNTIGMDRRGIWFSVAANDVYFYVGRPNPYPVVSNQWLDVLSSNTEQWNHLVVTHDGTLSSNQYTLYVNGVNKGTASRVNSYSTGQSFYSMKIGINKTDGTIQPFLGEIDELGFWTRCLEATEVNELYNFGAGRQYPFSSTPPITNMIHLTTIQNAQNACYNASQMLEFGTAAPSFLVENGGSATMISGQTILLKVGTSVQSGGYLHGYIAPAGPFCPSPSLPSNTVAKDSQNSEETLITEADQSGFTLFPNPTTGMFILELTNEPDIKGVDVELFNLFGQKILTQTLYAGRRHSFSIEEQQSGIYLFKISINGATEIRKIIKSPW